VPELPDVTIYVEALRERIAGCPLLDLRIVSPFVLRSVDPPIQSLIGSGVSVVRRLGKRIVIGFEGDRWLVIHLMIAGRLQWKPPNSKPIGKIGLACFDFDDGTLILTEASSHKRASIYVVAGESCLASHDPGGIEPLEASLDEFAAVLRAENRTLKRALTQPNRLSGIGNAYSDEILHAARLSPLLLTRTLDAEQMQRLWEATRATLTDWTERLRMQFAGRFPGPGEITAFRPDFAVHGKFGKPCPVCDKPVQRIRYAENETNYCAICQNEGRVLADRSLSRLLKDDWPRTLED